MAANPQFSGLDRRLLYSCNSDFYFPQLDAGISELIVYEDPEFNPNM